MGYAYVTVTDQSGVINLLYASITWSGSSGSTTVYVNIEGVHSAGASWRVRQGSSTPLQGSGIGDWTFTGTIGQTYQLQAVDPNTSNWAWYGGNFTLTADSSSGGGSGGGSGGSDSDEYYLWIKDVEGVHVNVYYWEDDDYHLAPDDWFFEDYDDDGLWYGLEISDNSWFRFEYEFSYKCTLNDPGIYDLEWSNDDHDWGFYGEGIPYIWPEITKTSSIPDLPNVS